MNYTISSTKRNLMILSAALLSVLTVFYAFYFFGLKPGGVKPDIAQIIALGLLRAVPHIFLLIVLFDYFRHQGWKVLQYTLLLTVLIEIVTKAFTIINQVVSIVPNHFYYSATVTSFFAIAMIIQAIFLLRLSSKEHPEVFSLQKYAVGLILLQIIAFGIPVVFKSESSSSMMLIIRILSAIPYLFLIEFALKLKSKEAMVYDSGVNS